MDLSENEEVIEELPAAAHDPASLPPFCQGHTGLVFGLYGAADAQQRNQTRRLSGVAETGRVAGVLFSGESWIWDSKCRSAVILVKHTLPRVHLAALSPRAKADAKTKAETQVLIEDDFFRQEAGRFPYHP